MSDFDHLDNGIFVIRGREIHSEPHLSRFAMRFVQGGTMNFNIDGQSHKMDSGGVVLFREYSSYTFDSGKSESLHTGIAFKPSFVQSAAAAVSFSPEELLELPITSSGILFAAHTRWPHSRYGDSLGKRLYHACSIACDRNFLDELAYEALNWYICENAFYQRTEPRFLKTKRQSTRLELAQRLKIARELIEYETPRSLSVSMLARESGISEFHFIRLYQQAFGLTPHRHIIEKRLRHAHSLLLSTALPVSDISMICGYDNHSAFSRAFRQFYGFPPGDIRSVRPV